MTSVTVTFILSCNPERGSSEGSGVTVTCYNKKMNSNSIPEQLLDIRDHAGPDYKPLIDFESWRVALMNYTPDLLPEKIRTMQRHNETDEVFVLLAGRCILFLGEGGESVGRVHAVNMQPFKLYNVRRGTWHSHTFSEDARVLIVENRETTAENSPSTGLTAAQCRDIVRLAHELWAAGQRR